MKYLLYACLGLSALISVVSCSQEEIEKYHGVESGLYIQQVLSTDLYGNPLRYADSLEYSFANEKETTRMLLARFVVTSIGNTAGYDRPYVMKVVPEGTTAVAGEDYDLSRNDFVIKARQARDTVDVLLLRTNKLRSKTLRLKLGIQKNEHFEIPFETYKNSSSWKNDGSQNSATNFLIKYDERYQAPWMWSMFAKGYFGNFTAAVYLELNKVMEWTGNDWSASGGPGAKIQIGKFAYAARKLQKHLQEMADNGTPVLNDDGAYMQLPDDYKVDYTHIGSKE